MSFLQFGFLQSFLLGAVAPELTMPDVDISAPINTVFTWFSGIVTANLPVIVGVGLGMYFIPWGIRKAMSLAKTSVR